MAILTSSGRTAMAMAIVAQQIHFAWGVGEESWDATPVPESVGAIALTNEIGRRLATSAQYVYPDASGDIIVPVFNDTEGNTVERRFTVSDDPTGHIYMRFNFDFGDAPASVIREVAIFIGTVVLAGLPSGQKYFVPAEIADPGTMLALEHLAGAIQRSPTSRQSFEFVLTI